MSNNDMDLAADVFGIAPEIKPQDDRLEIPAFLKRTHPPEEEMQQTDQPDDGAFKGSDSAEMPTESLELQLPDAPTVEELVETIRRLGLKIDEWTEKRRLLKVQVKKMVEKL